MSQLKRLLNQDFLCIWLVERHLGRLGGKSPNFLNLPNGSCFRRGLQFERGEASMGRL